MAVIDCGGSDAQAKELVLRVLRHDARIAHAIKLDAMAFAAGIGQGRNGMLHRLTCRRIAVAQQSRNGVVNDLHDHVTNFVIVVHRAMHKGHAFIDVAGQLDFEIGQAVVAHAAAKTHHGGFADLRARSQLADGQERKAPRVGQQEFGDTLLGRWQRRDASADAVKHGQLKR